MPSRIIDTGCLVDDVDRDFLRLKERLRKRKAMLSIPATKGFEIGSGFYAAKMRGSDHNDSFIADEKGAITLKTHCAGGTLGGISTGMPLLFNPISSLAKPQSTVDRAGHPRTLKLPKKITPRPLRGDSGCSRCRGDGSAYSRRCSLG